MILDMLDGGMAHIDSRGYVPHFTYGKIIQRRVDRVSLLLVGGDRETHMFIYYDLHHGQAITRPKLPLPRLCHIRLSLCLRSSAKLHL